MFDVGWTEMLVIAIVMIVVVGPKDLPNMLRTFGRTTAKLRAMAGDFQKQFNDALKEAELEDVKKSVDSLRSINPATEIRKQLNPFEKAAADVRAGLDAAMKPKVAADVPVVEDAQPAEPLKNGATQMPAEAVASEAAPPAAAPTVNGPDAMPAPPAFPPMTETSRTETAVAAAKPAAKARATRGETVRAAAAKTDKSGKAASAATNGTGSKAKTASGAKTRQGAIAKTPVSTESARSVRKSSAPKSPKADETSSPENAPARTAGKIAAGPAAAKKARGGK